MKYWSSLILFFLSAFTYAQSGAAVDEFLKGLKKEYPEFKLVYLNDNLQMHSFEVVDNQLVILDIEYGGKGATRADKKCTFYLLDLKDKYMKDTLTFQPLAGGISRDKVLHVDRSGKSVFFRPSYGTLPTTPPLRFFQSLSLEVALESGSFGKFEAVRDEQSDSDSPFAYYMNERNFSKAKDRKTISFSIKGVLDRSYRKKDFPDNTIYAPHLHKFFFPHSINPKGLILLDALAGELVMANTEKYETRKVTLPKDFYNSKYGTELLYDEAYEQVYLRLSLSKGERLYWLKGDRFESLDLKLPIVWDESDAGISRKRQMVVHEGKLYIMLNITEGGQSFDGIFMTYL